MTGHSWRHENCETGRRVLSGHQHCSFVTSAFLGDENPSIKAELADCEPLELCSQTIKSF